MGDLASRVKFQHCRVLRFCLWDGDLGLRSSIWDTVPSKQPKPFGASNFLRVEMHPCTYQPTPHSSCWLSATGLPSNPRFPVAQRSKQHDAPVLVPTVSQGSIQSLGRAEGLTTYSLICCGRLQGTVPSLQTCSPSLPAQISSPTQPQRCF